MLQPSHLRALKTSTGKRVGVTVVAAALLLGAGALAWSHNQAGGIPRGGRYAEPVAPAPAAAAPVGSHAAPGYAAAGAVAVDDTPTTIILVRSQDEATGLQTAIGAATNVGSSQGGASVPSLAVVVAETDAEAELLAWTLVQANTTRQAAGLPAVTLLDRRTP